MAISNEAKVHGFIVGEVLSSIGIFDQLTLKFQVKSKRNIYSFTVFREQEEICSFAVYVKSSSKRISPWRFTFLQEHQEAIAELNINHDDVFIALVNGNDGVACFNHKTLKKLLDDHFEESEWISVRRKSGEQYTVAGKDGKLTGKLALSEFPSAITEFISVASSKINDIKTADEPNKIKRKLFGFL